MDLLFSKATDEAANRVGYLLEPLPADYLFYDGADLAGTNLALIQSRALLIEEFNKIIAPLLPVIDLMNEEEESLGAIIRRCNCFILMKVKHPLLWKSILSTATDKSGVASIALVLDNGKAMTSRDKNETDIETSQNIFAQAFRQMDKKDVAVFRFSLSDERPFRVSFSSESGIDAGGVYREAMSRIVEDLFSPHFNLLSLCANGQHGVYINTEKYIPNVSQLNKPLALKMFEFIGRMMGRALRTKADMAFDFPLLIWKKIMGETVDITDLAGIDFLFCKELESIKHCDNLKHTLFAAISKNLPSSDTDAIEKPIYDNDEFIRKFGVRFPCFVYSGSDGMEREVFAGSRRIPVTFHNRKEYCEKVLQLRLNEFDPFIAAISKGLYEVVSTQTIRLFTAAQLEELVCGNPVFDMALWKSKSDISGLSKEQGELFWKVLESLSPQEKSAFVRFAWGRSRLPSVRDFKTTMRVTSTGRKNMLPVSHTCFFSIELPAYETEDEMRRGILTAINFGLGGILNS
jgi:hypothetical protein